MKDNTLLNINGWRIVESDAKMKWIRVYCPCNTCSVISFSDLWMAVCPNHKFIPNVVLVTAKMLIK